MNKLLKTALSYSLVIGMPIAVILATVYGNWYMLNIIKFGCWLTAIMATILFWPMMTMNHERFVEFKEKILAAKRVPIWLDFVCDILALLFLVAHGMFLLGSLWAYQLILMAVLVEWEPTRDGE